MRSCGTHLVFFQEQPGDADVPVLEGVHEGSDSTAVSAVRLVLAPGRGGKNQDRAVGSSKILTEGDSQQLGLNMEYIKPIHRPWINLSWCFRAWGMICGGGFLGSEIWFSSFGLYRSFVIPFFPDQRVSRRDKVCTGSREYYSTIPDPHGMMYKIKSPQISFRLNSSEN